MTAVRIPDFDLWREGYGGATVRVYIAGTSTLANLWTSPLMTTPIDNPITLDEAVVSGQSYGRFPQPVYVASAYYLRVSSGDQTGVQALPLSEVDGLDISGAVASTQDGDATRTISEWLARAIDVIAYGPFDADAGAAVNTDTLNAAIGVAAAQGGGFVHVPAGIVPINAFTLPEGVVLRGASMAATILTCQDAATICTLGGDGSGLHSLVLDGISNTPNSMGVDGLNRDAVVFEDVTLRRFAMGMRLRGGEGHNWRNLYLSSNTQAGLLAGDMDASATNAGGAFGNMRWTGGAIGFNTTTGLQIKAVDALAHNIIIENVERIGNLGASLHLIGARDVHVIGCWSNSDVTAFKVEDNTVTPVPAINTTSRITTVGGRIDGGDIGTACVFDGTCELVVFENTEFANVDMNLASPSSPIYLKDCSTDAQTTTQGLTQYLLRQTTDRGGALVGVTTGAASAVAWYETVPPGDAWILSAKVIARQTNGVGRAAFWITATVLRPPAELSYTNLVTAFTVGRIVTGTTSGASARIVADATSTLKLIDITGTFQNAEVITDTAGGEARVSGTISTANVALSAAANEDIKTPDDTFTGPTAAFTVSGPNAQLTVTGVSAKNIEWNVDVEAFKS